MAVTRSISACAPAHTLEAIMPHLEVQVRAERKLAKAECISPAHRAAMGAGTGVGRQHPTSGWISSGIRRSPACPRPWTGVVKARHQKDSGDSSKSSARVADRRSVQFVRRSPVGHFAQQPAAQGPRGIVLAYDGERSLGMPQGMQFRAWSLSMLYALFQTRRL